MGKRIKKPKEVARAVRKMSTKEFNEFYNDSKSDYWRILYEVNQKDDRERWKALATEEMRDLQRAMSEKRKKR